ncbi:hypothetical protein H0H93_008296 [Arthromyces matolae]|nr:hypothetical protein H0H93_008296 [Arthromyces matolae]
MEQEPGDAYIRRLASFVRINEKNLAEGGFYRRRKHRQRPEVESASLYNPMSWFTSSTSGPSSSSKPVLLSLDVHRLFYILIRMEALGLDVGTLDVQVDNPSRPMSYINIFTDSDKSDTLSLASFRSSLSAVSGLSLGAGWWSRPDPPRVEAELKYLYSCFTKIPALSVNAPSRKVIAELFNEAPNRNALPLDTFKNLQRLECVDIDPRTLLGWDRLAEGLVSLTIKKSGLEDIADLLIGAIVDDHARRAGSISRKRQRRIPSARAQDQSFFSTQLPESVPEDADAEEKALTDSEESQSRRQDSGTSSPQPLLELSSNKWGLLKSLSLTDNSLAFFPSSVLPYLTSLTHLDLSSNLLVSVPSNLGALYNLVFLNLSDNMIDSVLGIYLNLGQVLTLNVAHNRLESICGLERLTGLERIDLRNNLIEESAEIGRLAVLPNISEVWIEGNPFVEIEETYRVTCFNYFWKENKTVTLDGTLPGFYERRSLTVPPPSQMTSSRPVSTVPSPPVVPVGHKHQHHLPKEEAASLNKYPTPPSSNASPSIAPVSSSNKPHRKKVKRIVELDADHSDGASPVTSVSHSKNRSTAYMGSKPSAKVQSRGAERLTGVEDPLIRKEGQLGTFNDDRVAPSSFNAPTVSSEVPTPAPVERVPSSSTIVPKSSPKTTRRTRHGRYQTELIMSPTRFDDPEPVASQTDEPSSSIVLTTSQTRHGSSKYGKRKARLTASVFDHSAHSDGGEESEIGDDIKDNADAFRRRIEALKKDMGDNWLKIYSQSQFKSQNP